MAAAFMLVDMLNRDISWKQITRLTGNSADSNLAAQWRLVKSPIILVWWLLGFDRIGTY